MKTMKIGNSDLEAPVIGVGCMRMDGVSEEKAKALLYGAREIGLNFFDHADFYGYWDNYYGICEELFAKYMPLTPSEREEIILQTKCGVKIGPDGKGGFKNIGYDFSKEYILSCVDGSLKRLNTEYLDSLLLHIPDALVEPEEVAEAFDILEKSGKVRYFGVSNVTPGQLELLRKYVRQPLVFNQLQFSLDQTQLIDGGLYLNNLTTDRSINRDYGILDYCRLHDITIQAWSPLQFGMFKGCFIDHPDFPELNRVLGELGEKYGVPKTAVAIAWILRHPARMQAIAGTMNPGHLRDICAASRVDLTHQEWYQLYLASGKFLP